MTTPLLEAVSVSKSYGHVRALTEVDFSAFAGEVVALIGDNGAGKSTLVKVLSGAVSPDSGELRLDGMKVTFGSPDAARSSGLETVYQDLAVAPDLPPWENVFLGRERLQPGWRGALGLLDKARMRREAEESFDRFGVRIKELRDPVASLSGGQRQSVAICRALMWAERIIIMDEPTAALGVAPTRRVLDLIKRARDTGVGIVLISHNIDDVLRVADRIHVLRLGRSVTCVQRQHTNLQELVSLMTAGRTGDDSYA